MCRYADEKMGNSFFMTGALCPHHCEFYYPGNTERKMTFEKFVILRNEGSSSPCSSPTFIVKKILHCVQEDNRFYKTS
jgi:hypothetical protein